MTTKLKLPFIFDDGGRAAAGFKGQAHDCVTRAIAIAAQLPYEEVYYTLNELAHYERFRTPKRGSSARNGVWRLTYERYLMGQLGWNWTPTMFIGSGCSVHLRIGELPMGRIICSLSRHLVAVINGVIHDTEKYEDVSRNGNRCVYGYYQP